MSFWTECQDQVLKDRILNIWGWVYGNCSVDVDYTLSKGDQVYGRSKGHLCKSPKSVRKFDLAYDCHGSGTYTLKASVIGREPGPVLESDGGGLLEESEARRLAEEFGRTLTDRWDEWAFKLDLWATPAVTGIHGFTWYPTAKDEKGRQIRIGGRKRSMDRS
ncbi:hypothetical protein [Streptomyces sp. NPDC002602]|uniref:hypothetical protein n=1 Tax=Streptomyces sp. NPDC002602 TaxID=3364654 RepID=UPI0036C1DCFA